MIVENIETVGQGVAPVNALVVVIEFHCVCEIGRNTGIGDDCAFACFKVDACQFAGVSPVIGTGITCKNCVGISFGIDGKTPCVFAEGIHFGNGSNRTVAAINFDKPKVAAVMSCHCKHSLPLVIISHVINKVVACFPAGRECDLPCGKINNIKIAAVHTGLGITVDIIACNCCACCAEQVDDMLDNIRGKVGKMSDEILIAADRIILDVCIKIGKLCIVSDGYSYGGTDTAVNGCHGYFGASFGNSRNYAVFRNGGDGRIR